LDGIGARPSEDFTMRLLGIVISLLLGAAACDAGPHVKAQAYATDGTGQIRTCWGAGIQYCSFESANVPQFIDAHDPEWENVRAERKSKGFTMCYLDLPEGIISEQLLMFECELLNQRIPTSASIDSERLKSKLVQNLRDLADAAAAFEICASDQETPDEQSLEWTKHLLDLTQVAQDLSTHFDDDVLYLAFELARFQVGKDEHFKSETLDQTNGCAAEGLANAAQYVRKAQEVADFYLALPPTSLRGEAAKADDPAADPSAAARPPAD
jgi:hypothetical protein